MTSVRCNRRSSNRINRTSSPMSAAMNETKRAREVNSNTNGKNNNWEIKKTAHTSYSNDGSTWTATSVKVRRGRNLSLSLQLPHCAERGRRTAERENPESFFFKEGKKEWERERRGGRAITHSLFSPSRLFFIYFFLSFYFVEEKKKREKLKVIDLPPYLLLFFVTQQTESKKEGPI